LCYVANVRFEIPRNGLKFRVPDRVHMQKLFPGQENQNKELNITASLQ